MGYHYKEILCGYCQHRFVFNKDGDEWGLRAHRKKDGTVGIETKCPMCGETLVSFDDENVALPLELRDDISEIDVNKSAEIETNCPNCLASPGNLIFEHMENRDRIYCKKCGKIWNDRIANEFGYNDLVEFLNKGIGIYMVHD